VQSPFAQSLASNFGQSLRPQHLTTNTAPASLDVSSLNNSSPEKRGDEVNQPPRSPTEKLTQSWIVNEMLPVIEEERARSSYHSSDSVSSSASTPKEVVEKEPDIKSILNKSLSTINEDVKEMTDQLSFAKSVSFAPSLLMESSTTSTSSLSEPAKPTPIEHSKSATFHLEQEEEESEEEGKDK
jgi:hypothetical protein